MIKKLLKILIVVVVLIGLAWLIFTKYSKNKAIDIDRTAQVSEDQLKKVKNYSINKSSEHRAYNFSGIIKAISFNYEGEKLASGSNIEATSFLLVSYYDSKGQVQEILVGSSFHDETYGENGNAMIFGRGTNNSRILPDYFIDGAVKEIHSVGDIITIIFGTPNSTIMRMDNVGYTNDLINALHSEAQFAAFAATGNPSDLGSEVLVPFTIGNQLNN